MPVLLMNHTQDYFLAPQTLPSPHSNTGLYALHSGLFALISVLFVQFMQVTASVYLQNNARRKAETKAAVAVAHMRVFQIDTDRVPGAKESEIHRAQPLMHGSHHHNHAKQLPSIPGTGSMAGQNHPNGKESDFGHTHAIIFDARVERHVGTYILELGIASHRYVWNV